MPSYLPNCLTEACQAQGAVGLHRHEKVVALAEGQSLADLGRKDQPAAVSELNREGFGPGHGRSLNGFSLAALKALSVLSFGLFGCILRTARAPTLPTPGRGGSRTRADHEEEVA